MLERSEDIERNAREAADYAVQRCARDLLQVNKVAAHVRLAWRAQARGQVVASIELLRRMALRYCSRRLYLSCCSLDARERDCAFDNVRRYLQQSLERSTYAQALAGNAAEDVLQHTLVELHRQFTQRPPGGPDDPAAFLKWAQTILLRNGYRAIELANREENIWLDALTETYLEQSAPQKPGGGRGITALAVVEKD